MLDPADPTGSTVIGATLDPGETCLVDITFFGSQAPDPPEELAFLTPVIRRRVDTGALLTVRNLYERRGTVVSRPTSKDECTNGGWHNYGTTFKNQGDCVSFVATEGKNQPAG